ncbi:hypothetical protein AB9N12_12265 [Bacteroides sp. AN502(2024)]|uniref:hypothetical protein n=1 Tax=Bacteroides sp. AN502(2024) TaxID=3160599 RepID=UPI00351355CF
MNNINLKIFFMVNVFLLVLVVGGFTSCMPKDEIVEVVNNYQLRKKPGDEYFAIYMSFKQDGKEIAEPEVRSEAIFDGTFEPLNIQEVKNSDMMFILPASGKKYLMDGFSGTLMLEGNPFLRYEKDNAGGLYFVTSAGLYFMANVQGLPSKVDQYYRTGTRKDTFIYRLGNKWGVYQVLVKSGISVFQSPALRYIEILPAVFDKIRLISGDGAHHFVAQRDGKWQIYDGWGRRRYLCVGVFDNTYRLNTYSPNAAGERNVTNGYIKNILSIPIDSQEKYIPYLRTKCTYSGDNNVGIIRLTTHNDKYQSFFTAGDDHSIYSLPWEDEDVNAEYHY